MSLKEAPTELPGRSAIPYHRRVEFYLPLIVIGGIAVAILVYALALRQLGWDEHRADAATSLTGPFKAPDTSPVILYRSPTSARYLELVGGNYELIVKQWRHFLSESKRAFREIDDPRELADIGTAVLILPTAIALNDAEREAIVKHQQRGGSILATGAFGARDDTGTWRNWQLMQTLFGVHVAEEVPASAQDRYLVTVGDAPITHDLPAGTRIWLGSHTEPALRYSGGNSAGSLTDWTRSSPNKGSSLVYGDTSGARWVLFGFTENSWDAQPSHMAALAGDTLDWLQHRPSAYLAAWPKSYRAAHLMEMDTEEGFDNALSFASMLDTLQIRGAFYVLTSVAAHSEATLLKLAASHEIGYHGDIHVGFKGQAASEQRQRLEAMKKQLSDVYPQASKVTGFRAPTESYDGSTEEILRSLGILHHVADPNRTDYRLPLLSAATRPAGSPPMVVLPRTQRDDLNLLAGGATVQDIATALKSDLAGTIEQGALGVLSIHSQNFAKDSPMQQAVAPLLIMLAENRSQLWLATGSEIAHWWLQRSQLTTQLTLVGSRQELELSYRGADPVKNAKIIVVHPRQSSLSVKPTKAWIPAATVYPIDAYRSAIVFDEIKPGNYAYQLRFE